MFGRFSFSWLLVHLEEEQCHGVKVEVWKEKGELLCGETREEGRRAFYRIISDYQAAHG